MAGANWGMASQLQARLPHTHTSMEHLVMAWQMLLTIEARPPFSEAIKV
jgi:hypothetical protein